MNCTRSCFLLLWAVSHIFSSFIVSTYGSSDIRFVPAPTSMGPCPPGRCSNGSIPSEFLNPKFILDQVTPCEYKQVIENQFIGPMNLEPEVFCSVKSRRLLPRVTCCSPQPVTSTFPKMYLFPIGSRAFYTKPTQLQWFEPSEQVYLPATGDIVFLVAGSSERPFEFGSLFIQPSIQAWTQIRKRPVIVVDYYPGTYNGFQNFANARTVGAALGHSLMIWNITDRVILTGASLGGQIISQAGKYVKQHGKLVKECVALDPPGPFFDGAGDRMQITPNDCKLVQVIHTSSSSNPNLPTGVLVGHVGSFYHLGSCDFWINCGRTQGHDCQNPTLGALLPDVPADMFNDSLPFGCSHVRMISVYLASVTRKCKFIGHECIDCAQSRPSDGCLVNFGASKMALPPYNDCKPNDRKDYYVGVIGNNYPYCCPKKCQL